MSHAPPSLTGRDGIPELLLMLGQDALFRFQFETSEAPARQYETQIWNARPHAFRLELGSRQNVPVPAVRDRKPDVLAMSAERLDDSHLNGAFGFLPQFILPNML